jgi:catechol 2,3-dioxygenase-like lactoylglutathione lyase family enzyme
MEVLSGRLLLTPTDPAASRRFYGEVLGLAIAREFGPPEHPGVVFFAGGGYLELSGQATHPPAPGLRLWLQVRDVGAEYARLSALVRAGEIAETVVARRPQREPWGLIEMWLADPDGVAIVLVEIPEDHPLRRDQRGAITSPGGQSS